MKLNAIQYPFTDKIPNWTKSQVDKIPNGQNPEWTKFWIGQDPERTKSRMEKIPNWTKSRMDKIPNWTKSRMKKIQNGRKSRIEPTSKIKKFRIKGGESSSNSGGLQFRWFTMYNRYRRQGTNEFVGPCVNWRLVIQNRQNPELDKIPIWTKYQMDKISNGQKPRIEPTSKIEKVRINSAVTAGL